MDRILRYTIAALFPSAPDLERASSLPARSCYFGKRRKTKIAPLFSCAAGLKKSPLFSIIDIFENSNPRWTHEYSATDFWPSCLMKNSAIANINFRAFNLALNLKVALDSIDKKGPVHEKRKLKFRFSWYGRQGVQVKAFSNFSKMHHRCPIKNERK